MSYFAVAIYDLDGTFKGYAIMGQSKLQSTNIYQEGEESALNARLADLNNQVDLHKFWPHPQDPEVVALLDNPEFVPIEYVETEVIDDDRSYLVWIQEPETDERGNPTGQMVQGTEYDRAASVINYKLAKVPKRPTDVMWRIKQACEQVAKRRASC